MGPHLRGDDGVRFKKLSSAKNNFFYFSLNLALIFDNYTKCFNIKLGSLIMGTPREDFSDLPPLEEEDAKKEPSVEIYKAVVAPRGAAAGKTPFGDGKKESQHLQQTMVFYPAKAEPITTLVVPRKHSYMFFAQSKEAAEAALNEARHLLKDPLLRAQVISGEEVLVAEDKQQYAHRFRLLPDQMASLIEPHDASKEAARAKLVIT